MDNIVKSVIAALVYIIAAPFVGALLAGVDRKITARMQGRRGPSVLQPFWDVEKLLKKETKTINRVQILYLMSFLIFVVHCFSADTICCLYFSRLPRQISFL